jgi:hypothetical protein
MSIRGVDSAAKWQNYDNQTVVDKDSGQVRHGASAAENLKEAGRNLVNTFDPTNHIREVLQPVNTNNFAAAGIMTGLKVLMLPWAVMAEVADLVTQPVSMMKNLADAGAHSVAAGVKALFR